MNFDTVFRPIVVNNSKNWSCLQSRSNEGRLAHQVLLVQLPSEKNPASSSIPTDNFVNFKEIK